MNTSAPAARRRAVVIGAGIGGLTAAAALADHFGQIVVLERDALPPAATPRAGIPQANHVHGLLAGGLKALEQLLPGIGQDLLHAGALPLNGSLEVRTERPGFDPYPARDLGVTTIAASRALIEFVLRTRVECLPTVRLQSPCRVPSILFAPDGSRATGVRVDNADGQTREMNADLVIDASGRGGLTLDLLRAAGREVPPETVIGVDIGYASATYEVPPGIDRPWKGVLTFPQAPQSARGALMLPQEGGLWLLSLGGRGNDKPPGDEGGFLDFARHLRTSTIHEAIRGARRVGEIHRFAFPQSRWRHFGLVSGFPHGLLPIGDAVCIFNPIYGQGMSVAAQEALVLRRLLEEGGNGGPLGRGISSDLKAAYFEAVGSILETPWAMAAIPDFIFPQTLGDRPRDFARMLKLGFALQGLAARRPAVHRLMIEVQHLLKARSVYKSPLLKAQLLLESIRL